MTQAKPYPAYKPSGLPWLGDIPVHWELKRLKNVVSINPESLSETTDPDYVLQYVDISNVDEVNGVNQIQEMRFENAPSRARRIVRAGDTIVSTVRTYLKAIAFFESPPENLIASTGFAVLRPAAEVVPQYLSVLVHSPQFIETVVARSVGVSYPAIAPTILGTLPVWLPPPSEQHAIAAFLDRETARLDGLIAKKQRLIELLQEKRMALISHAVTKGLNPAAKMKDTGVAWLGEIPEHWEAKRLGTVAESIQTGPFGSQLHSSDYISSGYPLINPAHIRDGKIFADDSVTVDDATRRRLSRHILEIGDIVFGRRGEMGRCALVSEAEQGWLCGTGSLRYYLINPATGERRLHAVCSNGLSA